MPTDYSGSKLDHRPAVRDQKFRESEWRLSLPAEHACRLAAHVCFQGQGDIDLQL
jgi:hypothetical protein